MRKMNSLLEKSIILVGIDNQQFQWTISFNGLGLPGLLFVNLSHVPLVAIFVGENRLEEKSDDLPPALAPKRWTSSSVENKHV